MASQLVLMVQYVLQRCDKKLLSFSAALSILEVVVQPSYRLKEDNGVIILIEPVPGL